VSNYTREELQSKLDALEGAKDEGAKLLRSLISSELSRRQGGRPKTSLLSRSEQVRYAVQKYRNKDKP